MSTDCHRYLSRFVDITAETIDILIENGFNSLNSLLAIDMDKHWYYFPPQISMAQKILLQQSLAKLATDVTDDDNDGNHKLKSMAKRPDVEIINDDLDNQMDNVFDNNDLDTKEKSSSDNNIDVLSSVTSIDSQLELKRLALKTQPVVVISPLKMPINLSTKTVDNSCLIRSVVKTKRKNRLKCGQCDRFFKYKTSLESHVNRKHRKCQPFKCYKCNKQFFTNSALNSHLGLKHGIRLFGCDKCPFKGLTKYKLIIHQTRHSTDRPFVCNYKDCHKSFKCKEGMISHQKWVHSSERPFVCNYDDCNKSFKSKILQLQHKIRIHSSERLFPCNYDNCNKSYKLKKDMIVHQKRVHKNYRKVKTMPSIDSKEIVSKQTTSSAPTKLISIHDQSITTAIVTN